MKRNGRKSLAGALARAKNESGFTLVELIVVIAILGILAGVGTVGYSGYIKKANMAADEILLDSLNTAFAAACIENGVDASTLADDSVSETWSDGKVTAVSMYNEEFVKYFGGGVNSEFKVITDLKFEDGMFVKDGVDSAVIEAMRPVADAIKQVLTGSSYAGNEEAVIKNIQSLTNTAKTMADYLGSEELASLLGGEFGTYLTDKEVDTTNSQAVANYATLFVADQISGLSADQKSKIADIWRKNNFAYGSDPTAVLNGVQQFTEGTGLSTMGAMAVFYANAEACVQNMNTTYNPEDVAAQAQKQAVIDAFNGVSTSLNGATDINAAWNALADGYNNMIKACGTNQELAGVLMGYGSSSGTKDADAFLNAMGIINDNSAEFEKMTDSDNMYGELSSAFN